MLGFGSASDKGLQRLPLPAIRPELKIFPGPASPDGSPTWSLHDPVRNRYYRLGWSEFEMLSRWRLGNDQALMTSIALETPIAVTKERIAEFVEFLQKSNLTVSTGKIYREVLVAQEKMMKNKSLSATFKKYLFYRLPLVRPHKFLEKTYPYVKIFFARNFFRLVALIGIVGLYLASREMDVFLNTASQIFTAEGVAQTAIAIAFVKIIHEFAHAYTAYRLGCYVPTMGINFIIGVPILYTDVSDSWRLRSRYERISIGAAGIVSELCLAAIATLLWSFLSDGTLKNMCFFVAAVSWMMSVVVNLNPLMKFDGYFIASDFLSIPNFGSRATAITKWHFRKTMLNLDVERPEKFPQHIEWLMLLYGYCVTIYRLGLYMGISMTVYHQFFKMLGLAMMIMVVILFIIVPIKQEVETVMKYKKQLSWNRRTRRTTAILAFLLLMLVVPWNSRVTAPAVIRAKEYTRIFSPVPARIETFNMHPGQMVQKGDVLAVLYSPRLAYDIYQSEINIEKLKWQISRQKMADDSVKIAQVLEENLSAEMAKYAGFLEARERLNVRAPFSGRVVDVADAMFPSTWVNVKTPMAQIVVDGASGVTAYINESDMSRIRTDSKAVLYIDQPETPRVKLKVMEVDKINTKQLTEKMMISTFNGGIEVESGSQSKDVYTPVETVYRVRLEPEKAGVTVGWASRGEVHFEGERRSLFGRLKKRIFGVLIRESGF